LPLPAFGNKQTAEALASDLNRAIETDGARIANYAARALRV